MAKILYGAPVREKIKTDLIRRIKELGRQPVLAIVQVGDRADSNIYIKQKQKFGEEVGVEVIWKNFKMEEWKNGRIEEEIIKEIEKINNDKNIDGVIVQLPLPENLDREKILSSIKKGKDADGLVDLSLAPQVQKCTDIFLLENSSCSLRRASQGISELVATENFITPATARGVLSLLDFYKIEVKGKKVVVIGRSKLAGGPIAEVLKVRGALVKVFHKGIKLEEIKKGCRESDILISAAGQAGLVTREFVRKGQVVVDVGINRVPASETFSPKSPRVSDASLGQTFVREVSEAGKIVGDVLFSEVEPLVKAITPVPGGIGPLTVACLFQNLLDLIEKR